MARNISEKTSISSQPMFKPAFKSLLLILWIGLWVFAVMCAKLFKKKRAYDRFIQTCYSGILRIIGIRLDIEGGLSDIRPLMVVSNHVSYLDVVVLGAAAPVRFTPKREVGAWPIIGFICRLTQCVFIDRSIHAVKEGKKNIRETLETGEVVSLFPEATTGDGIHRRDFKPGFFSLASERVEGKTLWVQPVAIRYTHIHRLPIDKMQWPLIAWYGDMLLLPHLWQVLSIGGISVQLTYLPPIEGTGKDRKALAQYCQDAIGKKIEEPLMPMKKMTQVNSFLVRLCSSRLKS